MEIGRFFFRLLVSLYNAVKYCDPKCSVLVLDVVPLQRTNICDNSLAALLTFWPDTWNDRTKRNYTALTNAETIVFVALVDSAWRIALLMYRNFYYTKVIDFVGKTIEV